MTSIIILLGNIISSVSKLFGFGAGGTWPGEIALRLKPNILSELAKNLRKGIILVSGTNGKTTTSLMISKILEQNGVSVVHNASGANLLNGIVSALIQKNRADWGVFEVDENSLPVVLRYIKPNIIVLLNLFRDQLDRYGEVDVIVEKWINALKHTSATYVLNADDPGVAFIGTKVQGDKVYFGVDDATKYLKKTEHATDSMYCLNCGHRLNYEGLYFSHIGVWRCKHCGFKRPTLDLDHAPVGLDGLYNLYNSLAASLVAKTLGYSNEILSTFKPAFGRQEAFEIDGKTIKIFLAKNPAGFNASLRTVIDLEAKNFLFMLNDRIPDGKDVSWIWDVDFEMIPERKKIFVSGERRFDMALRITYAELQPIICDHVHDVVKQIKKSETLFILATYSAMLDVRKQLIGKKIL